MRKVAGLVMVRNEADIIETFVRYNLRYLDELIIVLHSPHDDTAKIIEQLRIGGVSMAHFLVRSGSQLVRKALIGIWPRWVEHGRVDKSICISNHWLRFYQELIACGNRSPERLRDIAGNYGSVQATRQ